MCVNIDPCINTNLSFDNSLFRNVESRMSDDGLIGNTEIARREFDGHTKYGRWILTDRKMADNVTYG